MIAVTYAGRMLDHIAVYGFQICSFNSRMGYLLQGKYVFTVNSQIKNTVDDLLCLFCIFFQY